MAVRMMKKSWWVDFRFDHLRRRRRSPENSKAGALAYEAMLRQKLARGEDIDAVKQVPLQEQFFEQFAWKWFEEYAVPNNKQSELRMKKSMLRASLVPFFGKMPIEQITTHHIEQFKVQSLQDGVKEKTVNNRLAVLSKCLTTAYEWLNLQGTPPRIKWLKCPPPETDYLSPEESALLLSHADDVVYEMILTALRTGMRQGELKGLQWASINWQNQCITVRHSRCDYMKELGSPKSNRARTIPMHSEVYEVLFKRKKDTGYVFLDRDKKPFDSKRLVRRLSDVCVGAGLRSVGWHTLRHTFASQLAMQGAPLHAVQALLGHSTITTTMRYAHVAPSTLRTAVNMLNPKTVLSADFGQPVGNQWFEAQQKEISQKIETARIP